MYARRLLLRQGPDHMSAVLNNTLPCQLILLSIDSDSFQISTYPYLHQHLSISHLRIVESSSSLARQFYQLIYKPLSFADYTAKRHPT